MKPEFFPFALSALMGLIAWGAVSIRYFWPRLKGLDLRGAAEPILYLHLFRFVGLAFIMEGVVAPGLDPRWAYPAAFGDLGAALLAGLALLSGRGFVFRVMLWIFSIWGIFDLIRAAALGPIYSVPAFLHGAYFIPVLGVPLLLWTHAILLVLMFKNFKNLNK
jgi:hypothetical protein